MGSQRFYGYKYWTLEETPRCFYVGKGLKGRPKSKQHNHKCLAIAKRFGRRIEICLGPITHEDVCSWEQENILSEGTFSVDHSHDSGDIGCNFTRGGEGIPGAIRTPEMRARDSAGWTEVRLST